MNFFLIFIVILLNSCIHVNEKKLLMPTDPDIYEIIRNRCTEQNHIDGGEFVTIDSMLIKGKRIFYKDSLCIIRLFIHCTYQPAPLPIEYRRNAYEISADTTIKLVFKSGNWQL